jgi:hypothetical protein
MSVEQSVEALAEETEVLGENLPHRQFFPPEIPRELTRSRTRAAAVGSQGLTAWAMTRPCYSLFDAILHPTGNHIRTIPEHTATVSWGLMLLRYGNSTRHIFLCMITSALWNTTDANTMSQLSQQCLTYGRYMQATRVTRSHRGQGQGTKKKNIIIKHSLIKKGK